MVVESRWLEWCWFASSWCLQVAGAQFRPKRATLAPRPLRGSPRTTGTAFSSTRTRCRCRTTTRHRCGPGPWPTQTQWTARTSGRSPSNTCSHTHTCTQPAKQTTACPQVVRSCYSAQQRDQSARLVFHKWHTRTYKHVHIHATPPHTHARTKSTVDFPSTQRAYVHVNAAPQDVCSHSTHESQRQHHCRVLRVHEREQAEAGCPERRLQHANAAHCGAGRNVDEVAQNLHHNATATASNKAINATD